MFKLNQYLQSVKNMESCIVFYLMRPKHMYHTDEFEWVYNIYNFMTAVYSLKPTVKITYRNDGLLN